MGKRGQTWSMDVLIAMSVFLIGIIMLYAFLALRSTTDNSEFVAIDAELITQLLTSSLQGNLSFIDGQTIDRDRYSLLANLSYDELKRMLGIRSDFCIYLEDENGIIIPVNDTMLGIGSNRSMIGGYYCGPQSGKPS